jgi:MYXO-CTERM domain-containing protein
LCCGAFYQYENNISLTAAPEPPTLSMASVAGLALAVLALHRRRMRPR